MSSIYKSCCTRLWLAPDLSEHADRGAIPGSAFLLSDEQGPPLAKGFVTALFSLVDKRTRNTKDHGLYARRVHASRHSVDGVGPARTSVGGFIVLVEVKDKGFSGLGNQLGTRGNVLVVDPANGGPTSASFKRFTAAHTILLVTSSDLRVSKKAMT